MFGMLWRLFFLEKIMTAWAFQLSIKTQKSGAQCFRILLHIPLWIHQRLNVDLKRGILVSCRIIAEAFNLFHLWFLFSSRALFSDHFFLSFFCRINHQGSCSYIHKQVIKGIQSSLPCWCIATAGQFALSLKRFHEVINWNIRVVYSLYVLFLSLSIKMDIAFWNLCFERRGTQEANQERTR